MSRNGIGVLKSRRAGPPFYVKPIMLVEVVRPVMLMIPFGRDVVIIAEDIPRVIYNHHQPVMIGAIMNLNASY